MFQGDTRLGYVVPREHYSLEFNLGRGSAIEKPGGPVYVLPSSHDTTLLTAEHQLDP